MILCKHVYVNSCFPNRPFSTECCCTSCILKYVHSRLHACDTPTASQTSFADLVSFVRRFSQRILFQRRFTENLPSIKGPRARKAFRSDTAAADEASGGSRSKETTRCLQMSLGNVRTCEASCGPKQNVEG